MSKLNILELHRTINEKNKNKGVAYDKVLELCHKRVKFHANNLKLNCFYEVPLYVFGYPTFDISKCIEYLKRSLENDGFLVKYYFPKYLYISWDLDEIKRLPPPEMPKITTNDPLLVNYEKKNKILTYKPSGKLQLNLL
jgi:hypothetical protein